MEEEVTKDLPAMQDEALRAGEEEFEPDFDGSHPVEIHPEMYATNLFGEVQTPPPETESSHASPSLRGLRRDSNFSVSGGGAFNIFSLTDAIGARDRRHAWVLYHKALAAGMVPEEVFYKLVWQIKTLLIAEKTKSVAETDMKPYPYSKAKGYLKNFKTGELAALSRHLVLGYHAARRGVGEIETLVEKTLLRL